MGSVDLGFAGTGKDVWFVVKLSCGTEFCLVLVSFQSFGAGLVNVERCLVVQHFVRHGLLFEVFRGGFRFKGWAGNVVQVSFCSTRFRGWRSLNFCSFVET